MFQTCVIVAALLYGKLPFVCLVAISSLLALTLHPTSPLSQIVVQRLADQVPMLIRYFILKQSAKIVCSEMLDLLHRDDTDNILQEDSEIEQYRAKLQAQLDRLILANDKISSL